jgi:hypothetical protein
VILVGKPEGKIKLGSSRRRWQRNIKLDIRIIVWRMWTGFIRLRKGRMAVLNTMGGRQSWSGYRGYRRNPLPLPGIEARSSSLVNIQ